jgi:hypothetical protein
MFVTTGSELADILLTRRIDVMTVDSNIVTLTLDNGVTLEIHGGHFETKELDND